MTYMANPHDVLCCVRWIIFFIEVLTVSKLVGMFTIFQIKIFSSKSSKPFTNSTFSYDTIFVNSTRNINWGNYFISFIFCFIVRTVEVNNPHRIQIEKRVEISFRKCIHVICSCHVIKQIMWLNITNFYQPINSMYSYISCTSLIKPKVDPLYKSFKIQEIISRFPSKCT